MDMSLSVRTKCIKINTGLRAAKRRMRGLGDERKSAGKSAGDRRFPVSDPCEVRRRRYYEAREALSGGL